MRPSRTNQTIELWRKVSREPLEICKPAIICAFKAEIPRVQAVRTILLITTYCVRIMVLAKRTPTVAARKWALREKNYCGIYMRISSIMASNMLSRNQSVTRKVANPFSSFPSLIASFNTDYIVHLTPISHAHHKTHVYSLKSNNCILCHHVNLSSRTHRPPSRQCYCCTPRHKARVHPRHAEAKES